MESHVSLTFVLNWERGALSLENVSFFLRSRLFARIALSHIPVTSFELVAPSLQRYETSPSHTPTWFCRRFAMTKISHLHFEFELTVSPLSFHLHLFSPQNKTTMSVDKQTLTYRTVRGLDIKLDLVLPRDHASENGKKLPIVVWFHGGGLLQVSSLWYK